MNDTFQDLLRDATRLTRGGQLGAATAAIQRALRGAAAGAAGTPMPWPTAAPRVDAAAPPSRFSGPVLDGCVFEAGAVPATADRDPPHTTVPQHGHHPDHHPGHEPGNEPRQDPGQEPGHDPGAFIDGSHTHAGLTRAYKLYVPPAAQGRLLPLVVMLHGCTQNPDDFAAGTGMNAAAREQGFQVLYPAQSQQANASRCWNWFKHNHQTRGRGEAALIASLTQAIVDQGGIDPDRVYIAGLSAGGAMAASVAAAYPELFAAVGVHSGLPPAAASNLPEALAAMRGGVGGPPTMAAGPQGVTSAARPAVRAAGRTAVLPLPVIVFHGDQDQTVHPRNGELLIAAALRSAAQAVGTPVLEQGVSAQGQRYSRTLYACGAAPARAEHWVLHGAGHAWSGGQAAGSYTDPRGPDASREMLRFFFSHPRARPL